MPWKLQWKPSAPPTAEAAAAVAQGDGRINNMDRGH